jgi:tetratricopeptide (TPR) repeat protein
MVAADMGTSPRYAPAGKAPPPFSRRFVCGFFLFILALAYAGEGAGDRSALRTAEELFKRREYDRARIGLAADTTSLSGTPLGQALVMLAALETSAGRAESLYRRAMTAGDTDTARRARFELAKIRYASGDYRGAVGLLSEVRGAGLGPDRDEALYFMGLCYRQLGETDLARAAFGEVTGEAYSGWADLGKADLDLQEHKVADAMARFEALSRRHANPIASFKLGECYETMGQQDKALEAYQDLVDRFPRSLEAGRGRDKMRLLAEKREKPTGDRSAASNPPEDTRLGQSLDSLGMIRGFTLQFGSFEQRGNAVAAAAKLEKVLPAVRVESIVMDGRVWHRVRAGFYESRDAVQKDLARAQEKTGLAGTIVPLK